MPRCALRPIDAFRRLMLMSRHRGDAFIAVTIRDQFTIRLSLEARSNLVRARFTVKMTFSQSKKAPL